MNTPPGRTAAHRARVVALFEAARDGDRQAFNDLIPELSPLLWQVARGQGLDPASSEDVVQIAWLSLLRDMRRIRDPSALVGWLITTTKREAWRARDRQRIERPTDDDLVDHRDEQPAQPQDRAVRSDESRRLWAAVDRLSHRCRYLLRVVAFVPRPDYGVVADLLGMAKGGVGPTRLRCLAKLKAALAADAEGGWS